MLNSFSKITLLVSLLSLMACAVPTQQTGASYSRDEARMVQDVQLGIIVDARAVIIEGTQTGMGSVVGGVVGSIAGSGIDDGRTAEVAAVLVGTAGAALGAKAESALTKAQGMEYTIQLDGGEVISTVQAIEQANAVLVAGDRVKILSTGSNVRVSKIQGL
jgi:outer membrane lipoprotein SlyB